MKNKTIKKIYSSLLISILFMAHWAPVGLCITTAPKLNTGVNKPALRENSEPTSLKLEGDISISKGNPKISLSLRDSDVQQVLRMFADKAGLNIIFHNSATGKVTMDLVNVPLNDAFKMVMQVSDLTYYLDQNTMVVMSSSSATSLNLAKQEMMVIPVKYVDAATMASFLNTNIFSINKPGLSNAQIAVTNPSTNEILIFGTKNDYLMAKKVIAQFDKKPLEQTFVVNHSTPKEMSDLLCKVLLKTSSAGAGGSAGGGSSFGGTAAPSASTTSAPAASSSSPSLPSIPSLLGLPTGGAAEASSSSSGGSSGGSSSGISLGTGVIACEIKNTVSAGSLSSFGTNSMSITYFPQRGTINVLGGSVQQMEMIKDFILKNDKKQPQAYLEVSIIELNEDGSRQFSNSWNVYSNFFSGTFDGTVSNSSVFPMILKGDSVNIYDVDGEDPNKILYSLSRYAGAPTISYSMNYIISNSKGRVLANPRIMITNGETSTIDLSSDYVKTVTSQVVTSTYSSTPTIQRTYEIGSDEGIKVDLTPFISPDGYVTLNIKPEYSTIKGQVTTPNETDPSVQDLQATLLQRRNLDLKNVRIKDGETLVIGGMIREVETKTVSKIPVLGDLPGVGVLFRNSNSSKSKEELVIMITPKIIKDTEDIVNNTGTAL